MKSIPTLITLTLATALTGCGGHEAPAKGEQAVRSLAAQTTLLQHARVTRIHAAPGVLVAENQVQVASRLMGYIRAIDVVEGQTVKAGQRLFSVDPSDVQGQAEAARAGLQQAEDAYADARLEHERYAALYKEEAVTRQQLEKMKLQADLAAARVAQAKAGLSTANNQLRYATVVSPIAGVVTQKLANAGDLAAPGKPLLVVENPGQLLVDTHVPEAVLARLKPGQTVEVEIDAQRVKASVARFSPAADPVSHLFLVKLKVPAGSYRSGQFVRVLFALGEREALRVPVAAVVMRAGISGVFVVDAAGIARFRMVRTGEASDGQIEILSGLAAGERVVTTGAEALANGDKVTA